MQFCPFADQICNWLAKYLYIMINNKDVKQVTTEEKIANHNFKTNLSPQGNLQLLA